MKKTSKSKIAATYALALYEAAADEKATAKVAADVENLQKVFAVEVETLKQLANPLWPSEDKQKAWDLIAKKAKLAPATLNCMKLLALNNRFAELPAILEAFVAVYRQRNNIEKVEVFSAVALSSVQSRKLEKTLEEKLKKKILLVNVVDPQVLGGLRIKYGSSMIDDSLESKLYRLESVMKGGQ